MAALKSTAYPVDLLREIDRAELAGLKNSFESEGWTAVTWGVDSHDAIEFTVYRAISVHTNVFVSLCIDLDDDVKIKYSVDSLVEGVDEATRANIESGILQSLTVDRIGFLLAKGTRGKSSTAKDLTGPLLAATGAAAVALSTVQEIVASLWERADDVRTQAQGRVEEGRGRLAKLQEELPTQFDELLDKLTADELRTAAERYADEAQATYDRLVERGEAALERLRIQLPLEDATGRAEEKTDRTPQLAQPRNSVASHTRSVGERAAKLVGVEIPKMVEKAVPAKRPTPAKKVVAKKVVAKKAVAKKAAGRRQPHR